MRHNNIRDFEAHLLNVKEVCRDVKVEPDLLPLGNTGTLSSNTQRRKHVSTCIGCRSMGPHGENLLGH